MTLDIHSVPLLKCPLCLTKETWKFSTHSPKSALAIYCVRRRHETQPGAGILTDRVKLISCVGSGRTAILLLQISRAERTVSSLCVSLTESDGAMNGLFNKTSLMNKNESRRMWKNAVHGCYSHDLGEFTPIQWRWAPLEKETSTTNRETYP